MGSGLCCAPWASCLPSLSPSFLGCGTHPSLISETGNSRVSGNPFLHLILFFPWQNRPSAETSDGRSGERGRAGALAAGLWGAEETLPAPRLAVFPRVDISWPSLSSWGQFIFYFFHFAVAL